MQNTLCALHFFMPYDSMTLPTIGFEKVPKKLNTDIHINLIQNV